MGLCVPKGIRDETAPGGWHARTRPIFYVLVCVCVYLVYVVLFDVFVLSESLIAAAGCFVCQRAASLSRTFSTGTEVM